MVVNRSSFRVVKVVDFTYKISMVVLLSESEYSTGSVRLLQLIVDGDERLECLSGQPTMKLLLLWETEIDTVTRIQHYAYHTALLPYTIPFMMQSCSVVKS